MVGGTIMIPHERLCGWMRLPHSTRYRVLAPSRPHPAENIKFSTALPASTTLLGHMRPPPPRCLLARGRARRGRPARCGCLHRFSEPRLPPPSQRASTMDAPASKRGGRDSCDAAPAGELSVPLPHSELHAPP